MPIWEGRGGSDGGWAGSEAWETPPDRVKDGGVGVMNTHLSPVRVSPEAGIRLSQQGVGQPTQTASMVPVPAGADGNSDRNVNSVLCGFSAQTHVSLFWVCLA